jgi:uncharacterized repeat protein (TIGR03803 family)
MKRLYSFTACLFCIALASCSGGSSALTATPALPNALAGAAGGFKLLYAFGAAPDAEAPFAELLPGSNGDFYGTAVGGGLTSVGGNYSEGAVFEISSTGKEKVLYEFQGGADGVGPQAGLIADAKGNLYGTTDYGGGASPCALGCGAVFELQPNGSTFSERVLYAFQGGNDGEIPLGTLLLGKNGVLYGTTAEGGSGSCDIASGTTGCGTVFALTPSGSTYTEKIIYNFKGGSDGESPRGSLIADKKGILYGTTLNGGNTNSLCLADGSGKTSCGVVFSLTPSGHEKILYKFKGGASDGANSRSALLAGPNGAFFGVTLHGGRANVTGSGTAFEMTKAGTKYTDRVIHAFCSASNCSDGAGPGGSLGLRSDSSGNLYGTTVGGGDYTCGCGTVFRLSRSGSSYNLTTLHAFVGPDGETPHDSVTFYKKTLYGTAFAGGSSSSACTYGCGTVFKVTP